MALKELKDVLNVDVSVNCVKKWWNAPIEQLDGRAGRDGSQKPKSAGLNDATRPLPTVIETQKSHTLLPDCKERQRLPLVCAAKDGRKRCRERM